MPRRKCDPEMARSSLIYQLRLSPCNAEELSFFCYLKSERVSQVLRELRSAGEVSILKTSRPEGPFFCLPGEIDPVGSEWNKLELLTARDYQAQYEARVEPE